MLLSECQMSNHKGAALMIDTLPRARALLADRGYDADWFRAAPHQTVCEKLPLWGHRLGGDAAAAFLAPAAFMPFRARILVYSPFAGPEPPGGAFCRHLHKGNVRCENSYGRP